MPYTDLVYKFKKIGKNVQIGRNVYFRYPGEVEIGDNVIIDDFCYFTTSVKIGDYCHISPSCSVIGGKASYFEVGNYCGIAAGCRIICGSDDFLEGFGNVTIPIQFRPKCQAAEVVIKNHVLIGSNTVILPNVTIAEGPAVGALSLVNKSTKEWYLHLGNPAKSMVPRNREEILAKEREFLNSVSGR